MKKILLIHNTYQHPGGEDSVLENEYKLLKNNNHIVEKLIFDNNDINSSLDKLKIGFNSIFNRNSAKIVEKKIKSFRPDIIHVHNFFPIASPSIFYVANSLNIPIVMTLHNYRLICPNALLFKDNKICEKCIEKPFAIDAILNNCYRESKIQTSILVIMNYVHKKRNTWNHKVDKYITLTSFAKNKMLNSSLKLEKNKIVIKPNFVEDYGYEYEKEDYFLFVGRLSIEKGINLLLQVFEKSEKKLIIIGSGPLENLVKEKALERINIEYLGYKDKLFIVNKLKKAKALIFSSIWYEGMPMTILESFSVATPVISPNIGGPNEIVQSNINGLKYQTNTINSLIEAINNISNNDTLHKKLCLGARASYEDNYTPEKNYKYLMNIYKKVINEKT